MGVLTVWNGLSAAWGVSCHFIVSAALYPWPELPLGLADEGTPRPSLLCIGGGDGSFGVARQHAPGHPGHSGQPAPPNRRTVTHLCVQLPHLAEE